MIQGRVKEGFFMSYMLTDWSDDQKIRVHRTILDLEEYCKKLPIEKQYEVIITIERLKSVLPDHYVTIYK